MLYKLFESNRFVSYEIDRNIYLDIIRLKRNEQNAEKEPVMKIVNHQDLIEKYENPILHTCNLKVGDIFLSVDGKKPNSAMISCNDGFRPVSFYIEVVN